MVTLIRDDEIVKTNYTIQVRDFKEKNKDISKNRIV